MKKLLIETYGCQMNVADSEVVASVMQMAGYEVCETVEEAAKRELKEETGLDLIDIIDILPHALDVLTGKVSDCGRVLCKILGLCAAFEYFFKQCSIPDK